MVSAESAGRAKPGAPRRSLSVVLYWLVRAVLTPVLRVLYRIRVVGRENVPRHGPVILAANHRSFLDSIFLPLVVGRRVTFVAKADYFESWKTAWFFRGVGQIPIHREGGSASERALAAATEVLEGGGVFAIYPEGTRSRDGFTHRGHTGVARLALRTGAPVVPVGLLGTAECQPVDRKLPRVFRRVEIRFGAPLEPAAAIPAPEGLALRRFTDELMFEVVQLCGVYEYRDTYATKRAEDVPTEPARIASLAAARVA
jgi:1-acyl-sn-glycerol-3-phosphate acyltransferase